MAGPTGIEPATLGLRVRCSSLTELRTRAVDEIENKTGLFIPIVSVCLLQTFA